MDNTSYTIPIKLSHSIPVQIPLNVNTSNEIVDTTATGFIPIWSGDYSAGDGISIAHGIISTDNDSTLTSTVKPAQAKAVKDYVESSLVGMASEEWVQQQLAHVEIDPDDLGLWQNENTSYVYPTYKGIVSSNGIYIAGGSGGEIYIPKVLYDHLGDGTSSDYKAATNWSTVDARGTITWKQIEGSEYERYYADGTPIGIINRDGLIASYDIGLASKWDTTTKMIASSIDTTLNAWNQPSQYGYNKPDTAGDVPTSFYDGYALCGLNIDFNGSAMSTYGSVITIEFCYASNDTSGINFFVGNRNENGTQVIGTVGPYPYTSFRTFRHIIIELTANGHQLYVDNVALNNGSTDRRNKGQARIVLNNNSYIGQVNVWNRALTADERAEHYQNYITNYHVGETAYDSNGNFVAT